MRFNLKATALVRCVVPLGVLFASVLATASSNNPVPQVVGPTVPQAVVPGSGAFTLSVYGANFVSGATVNWNGQARTTTFVSARQLQTQILASDVAKATAGYITVTNPPPGGGVSSSSYAIVEVHEPTKAISVNAPNVYINSPTYVVTADFTGSGALDLVSGTDFGQVTFNRGNGDGTFQSAYAIGDYYYPYSASVAFGDFDGDGTVDLVYGFDKNADPPTYLRALLGKGHGKFHGLPRFGHIAIYANGIVVGDFNRDGILDLAVAANGSSSGDGLYLGNGDGTFRHVRGFYEPPGSLAFAVGGDFNGDGKLDVVLLYGQDTEAGLYLLLGNGDGTFQKARRIARDNNELGGGFSPPLLVSDFNGDGNPDLAFCDRTTNGYVRIGVVLGNGDGTFQKPVYYATGFGPQGAVSFAAGDFNSDGKTDLIVATLGGANQHAQFKVFWGNGDGTFQKREKITLHRNGGGEMGLVPGDFNSDGLLDFVMANNGELAVYVQK